MTIKPVLDALKAVNPASISEAELKEISKQVSGIRMGKLALIVQNLRTALKEFDFNALSQTDKDFILDDLANLAGEVNSHIVAAE